MLGWNFNEGKIQFPENLLVNGMEQFEIYRTKEMFFKAKKKIFERFSDTLFA